MEIHIPYFTLSANPGNGQNIPRRWTDLSFLELQDQESYGLQETHFSFVICGTSNSRWVGYSFVDSPKDDTDSGKMVCPGEYVLNDPILNGEHDADFPIWDPRYYFLMVLRQRITMISMEWISLARQIELSVKRYVCFILLIQSTAVP